MIVTNYLAEISPARTRGLVAGSMVLFVRHNHSIMLDAVQLTPIGLECTRQFLGESLSAETSEAWHKS